MTGCGQGAKSTVGEEKKPEVYHTWGDYKKTARIIFKIWKNSQICRLDTEVDPAVTDLYIIRGYRESGKPWPYYVKSIFFPNNQAINVWTHFIPFLCFLYRYYWFIGQTNNPLDLINFPYYIHGLGVCLTLLASSLAHTFCSKSLYLSHACFGADFAAIYNYGMSFMVALESYICPMGEYCGGPSSFIYFMSMIILTGLVAAVTFFSNNLKCGLALIMRTVLYSTGTLIISTPCIVRFSLGGSLNINHPISNLGNHHGYLFFLQFLFLGIATAFYVIRYPEVCYVGKFDVLGNSHNWFHVFSALSMYAQSEMLESALEELKVKLRNGKFSADDLGLSWWITLGPSLFSILLLTGVTLTYAYVIYEPPKCKSE